ncbi:MAG: GAF domain-containing protein [Ignavibacteriales bacterium]|nr:GAF domain-containing protein [Ignavibacteriales bacterium]MCB9219041.1 GAF domain-containing protein [Ignavibacteriales bacterium]MCB9259626.1 GAF domain-containing protein [Ignavibacteriales bacterium]
MEQVPEIEKNNLSLDEIYKLLYQQINGLLNPNEPTVTNLSNVVAALKQTFEKISWVGFYLSKEEMLYLGPFQGKVACTRIKFGNGVCGTSALKKETQVVPNVHEYPGHIACDVETNSEIVIPIIFNNNVYGVLDLDSTQFSAFDETDKIWLEKICELIANKLELKSFLI